MVDRRERSAAFRNPLSPRSDRGNGLLGSRQHGHQFPLDLEKAPSVRTGSRPKRRARIDSAMQTYRWDQIANERMNALVSRQVIHGDTMTIARIGLKKGASVPDHSHVNEQISMVESGAVRFVLAGVEKIVKPGDILRIPPNVPHSAEALEDSVAVDLFSPRREDWIRGDDAYLRK